MDAKKTLKELNKFQRTLWGLQSQMGTEASGGSGEGKQAVLSALAAAKPALEILEHALRKRVTDAPNAPGALGEKPRFSKPVNLKKEAKSKSNSKSSLNSRSWSKVTPQDSEPLEPAAAFFERTSKLKVKSFVWAAKALGISVTADEEVARSAFRMHAKTLHPDANSDPQAPEAFQALKIALDEFLEFKRTSL